MTAPARTDDRPEDGGSVAEVRNVLARLVAFDTTSSRSNLELLAWITDEALADVDARTVHTPSEDGRHANLLVSLGPDAAGAADGGLVLSGHTDCVPVEGQPWSSDPFVLTERDGRLFGRGTCDMKGFIAAAIVAARQAARTGLARPLHLALSHSEELGCIGAPDLIADLQARDVRPAAVVVGEPTSLQPVLAHKGVRSHTIRVRGRDAHSSQPHLGANAIVALARVLTHYAWIGESLRDEPDPDFDPPYTTTNVGQVAGGTALNIIAREATATVEYRPVPRHDDAAIADRLRDFAAREVTPGLRAVDPEAGVTVTLDSAVPVLRPEPDGAALRLLRSVGVDAAPGTVAFATEAGQFQAAGWPVVVCGPGSIAQAHQPDEYVSVAQLAAGARLAGALAHTCVEIATA